MSLNKALIYSSTDIKLSELRTLDMEELNLSQEQRKKYHSLQERCTNYRIHLISGDEETYPFKFRHISSSPYIIYGRGNIELLHTNIIAIVWPRKATPYARQVLEKLFIEIQNYDIVTISGLADGVDMMVHELSLHYDIPTIAVLWGGLQYYCNSNKKAVLQKTVDNGGLILSEFKLDKKPERYTFPQRNRIVAGLSEMVFLPEAGIKSGSLITVDFARSMHKDVYGTPNNIFSNTSQGLLQYMQVWIIKPVVDMKGMLWKHFWKKNYVSDEKKAENQQKLWFSIEDAVGIIEILWHNSEWLTIKQLINETKLSTEELMSRLSIAEVLWQVKNNGGIWKII